jgi:lambda family phage portal protein
VGSGRSDLPASERRTLIARSHDAYRGYPLARAAVTRVRTNVIGTGLIAHPDVDAKALGIGEEEAAELNEIIDRAWCHYAEDPLECDAEATLDHYGQQVLVEVASLLSGDAFALTPFEQRVGCKYGLKVQLIDGARVSNPDGRVDTARMADGIEFGATGEPLRYWIRRRHPDDGDVTLDGWDAYPVFGGQTGRRRALHVWNEKDRIGQVRGAPFLAPILEPLQTLEQYSRSELLAALVSSFLTILIKKQQSQFGPSGKPLAAFGNQNDNSDGTSDIELGPGAVWDLGPGEEPVVVNPSRPNSKYDPFFMSVVTQMGAALELPVDELLLRYQASYSAARAAMLQAWRFYTMRRASRVQQFCQPVRMLWFDEAVARGIIPATNYADPMRRAAYTRCIWTGPARGSMDEQKEAAAARERIDIGISNETMECAAMMGESWSTVYAQRRREMERRKKDGLTPTPRAPAKEASPPEPEMPDSQEDDSAD